MDKIKEIKKNQNDAEKLKLVGELGLVKVYPQNFLKTELHSISDDSQSRHKIISMHFLHGRKSPPHEASQGSASIASILTHQSSKLITLTWDQLLNIFIDHPKTSEPSLKQKMKKNLDLNSIPFANLR